MIRLTRPACPNPGALQRGDYKHPQNKAALKAANHDKCMYCESKVTHIDYGDVEHILPKAPDLFPDLEFEWTNLGFSCGICNGRKGDKYFPAAPFVDPYSESPSDHVFACGALLLPRNGSPRGEVTIRELDLNRGGLLEQRQERLEALNGAVVAAMRLADADLRRAALETLHEECSAEHEYSSFAEGLLVAHGGVLDD